MALDFFIQNGNNNTYSLWEGNAKRTGEALRKGNGLTETMKFSSLQTTLPACVSSLDCEWLPEAEDCPVPLGMLSADCGTEQVLNQYLLIWTKLFIRMRVSITALRTAPCLPTLGSLGIPKVEMHLELPSLPLVLGTVFPYTTYGERTAPLRKTGLGIGLCLGSHGGHCRLCSM